MGVVYKARQVNLGRVVAVKMLRPRENPHPQELVRFRVEAEAVARLDHPHIVRIYDFGECNGLPYFSMEFVEGGNLAHKLAGQPLPAGAAAALVETLARAMHYAHQRKVIHRDLKPANVLLGADGRPKIADFGLAKCLDSDRRLTVTNTVMGTASYMAPEQAAGQTKEIGPAADVYALGAVLYETLTGRPPFRAETRELTILKVLHEEVVPPTHWRPEVPPDLEAICLKCLDKDPDRRYASALALGEDLRRFQEGETLAVEPGGELERQKRWARRAGYDLLELTGCSVTGMVYKARHVRLNRLVALKTISARAQAEPAQRERFRTEAEVASRLQHPHIVQIYDFGEQNGQAYFSLEFVEGGTLADRCGGAPVPAREAAALVETLARAAHFAHEHRIIHADLRPFNVLLTAAGVPKITGFGLARLLEENQPESPGRGTRRGLSNYMAPEQVDGRLGRIGPATDVHALGAMLYEMLAGRPPVLADTIQGTLDQILTGQPVPPSRIEPGVPRRLDAVCLKCLEKDPRHRCGSAADLADDLRRFLDREETRTDEFELIPGYELLQELGRGGTGVVYRARQVSLDRLVALKIFRERVSRILAANRAVGRLQHPNIVQVYDCAERNGLLYVAEELVDGSSLDQLIAGRPQPPHDAARLVETLARAMHYVHTHRIVHRNLKPSVVLLTALGIPKISSFDLARLLDGGPDEADTQIIGTPVYMAPEQVTGRTDRIGPATDVHALGVILYELLTGQPPFQGDAPLELLERVRSQPPQPPSRLAPGVPPAVEAICLKCLEKEPERRYCSAEALADAVRGSLGEEHATDAHTPVWRRVARWSSPGQPSPP
jgi:serine/threonine protein kinase